ncbi:hypothetical protein [Tautonia plasticadhaerens]|uniref:Uncharacterized protein n=1 Tax=Tautonia plasticadhaerens TaxID=2527974 RepID=A0A518H740_9BACT|nr:hypothetical protein [Tautonia plasticadhaerens]QDV36614.1 hypothetical protein ElP_45420 [Tautonia plasticadhaerens]
MAIDRSGRPGRASVRRAAGPHAGPLMLLSLLASGAAGPPALADGPYDRPSLERVGRSVSLLRPDRGEDGDHRRRWLTWRVEYRLRNPGPESLPVEPSSIFCTVEGWASNSRADGHGLPRRADHALGAGEDLESIAELIDSDVMTRSCAERATLQVWPEGGPVPDEPEPGASCGPPPGPFSLPPGGVLRARLRLEHRHHLHGPSEPLLGGREVTLGVGPASFRDAVSLEQDASTDRPIDVLGPIPEERLDPRFYFSPPDSLYLDAALSGFRSYQYRDLKVRRDVPMRLSFRYYRSTDSTGDAKAEVKQYQDVPSSYEALTQAKRVEPLDRLGEWVLVEREFHSEPKATTMQLKFIIDCEGDGPSALWIDEVTLEPVDAPTDRP